MIVRSGVFLIGDTFSSVLDERKVCQLRLLVGQQAEPQFVHGYSPVNRRFVHSVVVATEAAVVVVMITSKQLLLLLSLPMPP